MKILIINDYSTLPLIGDGVNKSNFVLIETINLLKENTIKIYGISTTSYRISVLIDKIMLEKSVNLCHKKWIE
ncbi:MAG: hypothetical protein IIC75_04605 [Bacteroidetes bacterium]|nr:hypothetical protein [Bacteroidota bacterium]